jgi:hypothetical protein
MYRRIVMILSLLFASAVVHATSIENPDIQHVIYITLDGTRWQNIFDTPKFFPKLWKQHAARMMIYGKPGDPSTMEVASIPVSLPSYQTQMTGAVQSCMTNECGQVQVQTLPEALLANLHLAKKDVAVFSSWSVIGDALESKRGNVYSSVGNVAVVDPITGKPDAFMTRLNYQQALRHHYYHGNRLDEYTFAQALHFFKKHQPVFLWISLVNADNEAHDNHPDQYRQVLASYDNYLDQLFNTLQQMHVDHNTMVVITTDHGRGNNANWITHGPEFPESKTTWAFVMNGRLQPVNGHYTTLSIRPTIETALCHLKTKVVR